METSRAEHGSVHGPVDAIRGLQRVREDGWRRSIASKLRQSSRGSAGSRPAPPSAGLPTSTIISSANGLVPENETLARDPDAGAHLPDQTRNAMICGAVHGRHPSPRPCCSHERCSPVTPARTVNGDAQVTCLDDAPGRRSVRSHGRLSTGALGGSSSVASTDAASSAGTAPAACPGRGHDHEHRIAGLGRHVQRSYKGQILAMATGVTG